MTAALLTRVYPAVLLVILLSWIFLFPWALMRLREISTDFSREKSVDKSVFALTLLAVVIRLLSPRGHLVLYDEYEHLDIARHLADSGRFVETVVGGLPGWDVLAIPTWPAGHHVLLAFVFKIFGSGADVAFTLSAVLGGLSVLFVFWAAQELFDNAKSALSAAALWAFLPLAIRWSGAADLTSSSLFWLSASIASVHARERARNFQLDLFCSLTLAYAVNVRTENALVLIYAFVVSTRPAILIPSAVAVLFPLIIAANNRSAALPGYSPDTFLSFANACRQFPENLRWLVSLGPIAYLIAISSVLSLTTRSSLRLFFLSLSFMLLYSSFFRGHFGAGSEDRFSLQALLPLVISAGAILPSAAAILSVGIAIMSPITAGTRRSLSVDAPPNAYVLSFNPPAARELLKRPAASVQFVLEDPAAFERARARVPSAPELLLLRDWAWRSRPEQAASLQRALSKDYFSRIILEQGPDSVVLLTPKEDKRP